MSTALVAAAFLGIFAAHASAQLIVNGSFETNNAGYSGVNNVVNSAPVTGWTLITLSGTSNISMTRPSASLPSGQEVGYPAAVAGIQYLGFNAQNTTAGNTTIYQNFATTTGASYGVTFSVGASSNTSGGE